MRFVFNILINQKACYGSVVVLVPSQFISLIYTLLFENYKNLIYSFQSYADIKANLAACNPIIKQ